MTFLSKSAFHSLPLLDILSKTLGTQKRLFKIQAPAFLRCRDQAIPSESCNVEIRTQFMNVSFSIMSLKKRRDNNRIRTRIGKQQLTSGEFLCQLHLLKSECSKEFAPFTLFLEHANYKALKSETA